MGLKKLQEKTYKVFLYGLQKEIRFRGFTTKEQEILLECQPLNEIEENKQLTDKQKNNIIESIIQIAEMCVIDDINIRKLTYFDLTHLFVELRKVSVNEVVELKYQLEHPNAEDERHRYETISVAFKLDDVNFDIIKNDNLTIDIDNDEGIDYKIIMEYPTVEYMIENEKEIRENIVSTKLYGLVKGALIDGEYTTKDDISLSDWVETFNTFGMINQSKFIDFLKNLPEIEHTIVLQSKLFPDVTREVKLKGIESFF